MTKKITPESFEAEQSALGACMMERDAIARAAELLQADDFYREGHKAVFEAIIEMFSRSESVDYISLAQELKRKGDIDKLNGEGNGLAYLEALFMGCPSAANIESYANTIAQMSTRRRLARVADNLKNGVYEGERTADELVSETQSELLQLGMRHVKGGFVAVREIVAAETERLRLRVENPNARVGMPTGFAQLDSMTNGLKAGELIILGARPSMGKSALAMQFAQRTALHEHENVAVFSLEMGREQLVQRMQSGDAKINLRDLQRGTLTDEEWERLDVVSTRLQDAPLFIDDTPAATIFQIHARARSLAAQRGQLGLIIVDYLQLARGGGKTENRVVEVNAIAEGLKALGREMGCPVVALSQLSRAVEQREDKRPMLSDLRESGGIEAAADLVMFLYRPGYYQRDKGQEQGGSSWGAAEEQEEAEVIITKQRNGPTGTVTLGFQKQYARFVDLDWHSQGNYS